ncbi:family 16 glycosylhydrolase [Nonomuraea sp. 10N515B]|uniref:family 16 glycosylhydrolase n=1 Tax=Nonomuraea sp. 10N515B TaxID=3457422 RepID=UPI003FCDD258
MSEPISPGMPRRQFLGATVAVGAAGVAMNVGLSGVAHAAGSRSVLSGPPPGVDWTQIFTKSDEFLGTALNTDKWTTDHWFDTNNDIVAFKPGNATVADGKLHIWTRKEDYNGMHYTVGYVRSRFTIPGNSYTEVRARMIPWAANVNSAIWLHNQAIPERNPNPEIDMQEYHLKAPSSNPRHIHSALHLWPRDPDSHDAVDHEDYDHNVNLDEGYHLYGLERRAGRLKFYIDGILYWSYDTSAHPEFSTDARPLILCCNGNAGTPVDAQLPARMRVDYVKVYTAG